MIVVKDIIKPCADWQRRTCIQVDRADGEVKYIELDIDTGLEVRALPQQQFDQRFQPLADYSPIRACQLYLEYSRAMGATQEVLNFLGAVTTISKEDVDMATKRKPAARDQAATTARKAATVKAAAPKAKGTAAAKPAAAAKKGRPPSKVKAVTTTGRETPAAMFRELILDGSLTDDAIFAKVQKKFDLDDSKRSYVAWYRNSLKKTGHKVPAPKK
jgi:hypothetical protein